MFGNASKAVGISLPPPRVARSRASVFGLAVVAAIAKCWIAVRTDGTNDVLYWRRFAILVARLGPVGIYSTRLAIPFNHPPLIGWMLAAVDAMATPGQSIGVVVRVAASLADVATALIVFEDLRRRHGVRVASLAGAVVACSPILIVISGFHGNTDPLLIAFILLSAWLAARGSASWAGATAAIAVSIKLVPIVALPVIGAALVRDPRRFRNASISFVAVLGVLWGPAITRQWSGFRANVLEYRGHVPPDSRWGIMDVARRTNSSALVNLIAGPGRFAALVIAALIPTIVVLKRPEVVVPAVGLSVTMFLLLTTNFGTQYLAWAAAPVLLLDVSAGIAYNLAAGVFLAVTYTHWAGGIPWDQAISHQLTPLEEHLGWLAWLTLVACAILGLRQLLRTPTASRSPAAVVADAL